MIRKRQPTRPLFLLCALPIALVVGCEREQERIVHYEAPAAVEVDDDALADAPAKERLLTAMVAHAERTWFFKLMGPAQVVAGNQPAFERFLSTVHFTDGAAEPMTWQAPEGWQREESPVKDRLVTYRVGPKEGGALFTITSFEGSMGGLLANVNRWRKQIGLRPTSEVRLAKLVKVIRIGGTAGHLVALAGPGAGADSSTVPPFMKNHPPFGDMSNLAGAAGAADGGAAQTSDEGIRYTKPPDWRDSPQPVPFAIRSWVVGEGERAALITVSPLSGPVGGVMANVNRWRAQLGLEPIDAGRLDTIARSIDVAGKPASAVDLSGKTDRLLGVIVPRGETTWFIKMKGPGDLVGEQKAAFDGFVKSIRFGGGK